MTLEERAKAIAEEANKCCNRSDGYEEHIRRFALKHLVEAMESGRALLLDAKITTIALEDVVLCGTGFVKVRSAPNKVNQD